MLPLVITAAVYQQQQQHQQLPTDSPQPKSPTPGSLLKLLFNLIEQPNAEQRHMLLVSCAHFARCVGPLCVNNELLPQCWEQLSHPCAERRCMIAEACALLAPCLDPEMRSSLMFSILKQVLEEDKAGEVLFSAAKSLAILLSLVRDEQKFSQCIHLLDLCATADERATRVQVEQLMLPSLSLWALDLRKFHEPLMWHMVNKCEYFMQNRAISGMHALTYMNLLRMNLQFVFAYVLVHFRDRGAITTEDSSVTESNSSEESRLAKLNTYFHTLQQQLPVSLDSTTSEDSKYYELYRIDSILDDYLPLTDKYLQLIINDTWTTAESLADAFTWLTDKFVRKLIQLSAQVDASDPLCAHFVRFFRDFVLLFAIDADMIRHKIVPIFEKLLNVSYAKWEQGGETPPPTDAEQQSAIEQLLTAKTSCPLFKATLPVYFVSILSTLLEGELNGWYKIVDEWKTSYVPSTADETLTTATTPAAHPESSKRLEFMTSYLKNLFFTLSLNQKSLDGLVSIYELLRHKGKANDYIVQMLLSTLWDGIVHMSLYVRCNTAKLFEILVKDCDENLLSTRILPALITLANDLDKMVRCSSVSPLTCIVEHCANREILERVYTQLQSFLSDPILGNDYLLQIELCKTFRRVVCKVTVKFREEFILPYLAILMMQMKTSVNDNDYEFSLATSPSTAHASATAATLASLSPTAAASSTSTTASAADVQRICVLVFDIFQRLYDMMINTRQLAVSRQSMHESLLPGMYCLREIFSHTKSNTSVSQAAASNQREYVKHLDEMAHRVEQLMISPHPEQQQLANAPKPAPKEHQNNHNVAAAAAPTTKTVIPAPQQQQQQQQQPQQQQQSGNYSHMMATLQSTVAGAAENSGNLKSLMYKGFANIKDTTSVKDKWGQFMAHTNKNVKK